jgi:hypothetical protein
MCTSNIILFIFVIVTNTRIFPKTIWEMLSTKKKLNRRLTHKVILNSNFPIYNYIFVFVFLTSAV